MPTDSLSFADLKGAVKQLLDTVDGIGTVETRVGGMRGWSTRPAELNAFWEISVTEAREERAGTGPQAFERPVIRIEGFLAFKYETDTEAVWDALLKAVRDTLRTYFGALHGLGATGLRGEGLPQLTLNRVEPYRSDHQSNPSADRTKLIHHAVIELEAERWFTHAQSNTLP